MNDETYQQSSTLYVHIIAQKRQSDEKRQRKKLRGNDKEKEKKAFGKS